MIRPRLFMSLGERRVQQRVFQSEQFVFHRAGCGGRIDAAMRGKRRSPIVESSIVELPIIELNNISHRHRPFGVGRQQFISVENQAAKLAVL